MAKISGYIPVSGELIHYIGMGAGRKLLLAFHGYADNAELFLPLSPLLEKEYTIISVDLPHHGKCQWPEHKPFAIADLETIVLAFKTEYDVDKISLLGYSLGGRVCLQVIDLFPGNIDRVVLAAPDGLAFNSLYYFVTRTFFGKRLFRSFLSDPEGYMYFIALARKRKWLDESRYKFAMQYLQTKPNRDFLLKVWPCMSLLMPKVQALRKTILNFNIPVHIFMGRHDRIIPLNHANKFEKELNSVQLHILNKGHRLLDAETMPQIAASFL